VAEQHDVTPPAGAKEAQPQEERPIPVRLILLGILGLYLLLFAVLNAKTVKVSFVVFTTRVSLIVALVLAAVLGFGAGYIANELRDRRKRRALPKA
jgi:uncharacterized integral membrane protein